MACGNGGDTSAPLRDAMPVTERVDAGPCMATSGCAADQRCCSYCGKFGHCPMMTMCSDAPYNMCTIFLCDPLVPSECGGGRRCEEREVSGGEGPPFYRWICVGP
jgi:hypothetical protein